MAAEQEDSTESATGHRSPELLFTKDFLLAVTINLLMMTAFFALIVGMAVYAAAEFAAGETAAGLAASIFVIGAVLARLFAGKWVNTLGRRRCLVIALAAFSAACASYLLVVDFTLLLALRFVHGVALGFGQTALTASVFDLIPATRRGEGAGYFMLATSLPPALGPALTIYLSERYGFSAVFLGVTLVAIGALSASLIIKVPEVRVAHMKLRDRLSLRPKDVIEPRAFSVALVVLLIGGSFASVMTFLNGFAMSLGMIEVVSIYFAVYSLGVITTRLFSGKLQDKYGDNAVVYPALGIYFCSMILLAWSPHEAILLLSGLLAGFGFGTLLPALQAIIASALPPHRTSIGISTFFILLDGGFGFAPLLLGPLLEWGDYRIMYIACAGLAALNLMLYWFVHGRHKVHHGVSQRSRKQ